MSTVRNFHREQTRKQIERERQAAKFRDDLGRWKMITCRNGHHFAHRDRVGNKLVEFCPICHSSALESGTSQR